MLKKTFLAAIASLTLLSAQAAHAQSPYPFVDEAFDVPPELETPQFRLRMLTVHDVVKDFEAVIASKPQLLELFPSWGGWPEGLTLEDNLVDLGWHQDEFNRRNSFAYTVISLDGSKVLGCVYINPTRKIGYDAEVYLWARESAQGEAADARLEGAVRAWLAAEWPFANPALPGRDLTWSEWEKLPEAKR